MIEIKSAIEAYNLGLLGEIVSIKEPYIWDYLRGYVDKNAFISSPESKQFLNLTVEIYISVKNSKWIEELISLINIPYKKTTTINSISCVSWQGVNGLDMLGKLYYNSSYEGDPNLSKLFIYKEWCSLQEKKDNIKVVKTDINAKGLSKSRVSDSGYDLTLIKVHKKINDIVTIYDTGIQVSPPYGYYFDLVARSSLIKTGYFLFNCVGIIDRGYTGNILVPLAKLDNKADNLELPAKVVQLIPRPIIHFDVIEVESLNDTSRNIGGFGSTNK